MSDTSRDKDTRMKILFDTGEVHVSLYGEYRIVTTVETMHPIKLVVSYAEFGQQIKLRAKEAKQLIVHLQAAIDAAEAEEAAWRAAEPDRP